MPFTAVLCTVLWCLLQIILSPGVSNCLFFPPTWVSMYLITNSTTNSLSKCVNLLIMCLINKICVQDPLYSFFLEVIATGVFWPATGYPLVTSSWHTLSSTSPQGSPFLCPALGSSLVFRTVKRLPTMQETWVQSLGREDLLEKEMAIHSRILAWKIPWMEEPG